MTTPASGKTPYLTPSAAQHALRCLLARPRRGTHTWARLRLQVYRCPTCAAWHLGHSRQRRLKGVSHAHP